MVEHNIRGGEAKHRARVVLPRGVRHAFTQTGVISRSSPRSQLCALLLAGSLLGSVIGCALPKPPAQNAVGVITNEQGELVPFASVRELSVAGLLNEAMLLSKKGRFRDAETRLRQARYLEPGNERLEFNLAVVLNQTGQSEEAQEILRALIIKRPGYPDYLIVLADSLRIVGEGEEGRKLLREAFDTFKRAENAPRATLVARSLANIDFGLGLEQEALCYSYEALSLSPGAPQFGQHLRMLVALNLFKRSKELLDFVTTAIPGWLQDALVQHMRGVTLFALEDYEGALVAEENALNYIDVSPELGGEVNAAWWLIKSRAPAVEDESEEEKERFKQMRQEVIDYREQQSPTLITWPAALREEMDKITNEDNE